MKQILLNLFLISSLLSQYNAYDLNHYDYSRDSLETELSTSMLKSFIIPGWGQLSNKDPLWKPFIGFWLKYRYGITRKSKKRKTE